MVQEYTDQRVSLVLLTYNCADHVGSTIERLLPLGLPIIAVDNGSSDETFEVLRNCSDIETIALSKNIGAAARNIGVKKASTPYVAFCDDDTAWELEGLQIAADMFDVYPRLALINARIYVGDQQRLDPVSEQMADSPLRDETGIPGSVLMSFMGGASIVRTKAWQEVGGYEPRLFIGGEEENTAWKLIKKGWEMRYVSKVVVHHYPSNNNANSIRHYGIRNTIWTAWLHRPFMPAMRWTWHIIRETPKNSILLRGLMMTVPGIPWVIKNRQPFAPAIENKVKLLERQRQEKGMSRRYGIDGYKRKHQTS